MTRPIHQITRRSGVIHYGPGNPRMTFAMVNPKGQLSAVIDAHSLDDAWVIGTGWEDKAGIAQRKAQGWKVVPCMVEWAE